MSKRFHFIAMVLGTAMAAVLVFWGVSNHLTAQDTAPPPPLPAGEGAAPAPDQNGPEVLTRGPIHEAFVEMVNPNAEAGQVVGKQPPQAIEEMPPTEKPAGDYIWVPGYWSWDQDRNDYIWISGVWRLPPPGTTWVPGYWNQVANGFQWVRGYWGPATVGAGQQTVAMEYLPPPPQSREIGPNAPAPSEEFFWVPGCWRWRVDLNAYVWQPGHWSRAFADWVWIPDHYVWTPAGYVFIAGHWDYVLDRRGVAFCPVYYAQPYYLRPRYFYSPTICIEAGVLHGYLFCRPQFGYYFGDYYDPAFVTIGIYPWFDARCGYEPLYVHDHWYYRHDPMWDRHLHEDYAYRRVHPEARPPHTYALAVRWNGGGYGAKITFATHVSHYGAGGKSPMHFERISQERREQFVKTQREVRASQVERRTTEMKLHTEAGGRPLTAPVHRSFATAAGTTSHQGGTQANVRGTTTFGNTSKGSGSGTTTFSGKSTGTGTSSAHPPRAVRGRPRASVRAAR